MDFVRPFTFLFEDKDWLSKSLIGVLVALAGILILPLPILAGYMVAVVRNVMRGDERLPSWDNIGQMWVDGLALWVATFVYSLPFVLLPMVIMLPAVFAGGMAPDEVADALGLAGLALTFLALLLWAAVFLFVGPALTLTYARTGSFGALFQVGQILALIRRCLGTFLALMVYALVVGLVIGVLNSILSLIPCIGWLLSLGVGFYVTVVIGHIYGQAARQCPA